MQVIQLELLGLSYRNHVSIIHVDECIDLLSPIDMAQPMVLMASASGSFRAIAIRPGNPSTTSAIARKAAMSATPTQNVR